MQFPTLLLASVLSGVAVAQITPNLTFNNLANYLPFASVGIKLIQSNPDALAQVNAANNDSTVFLPLDIPYNQFIALKIPNNTVAGAVLAANIKSPALNTGLAQYIQVPNRLPSAQLNGTYFVSTRLTNSTVSNVTGGAKVEVVRSSTQFYIKTGINLRSNVVIADIPFKGGLVHILDSVVAPPYSLVDTGTIFGLGYLIDIKTSVPQAVTAKDVTVFVPPNSTFPSGGPIGAVSMADYAVAGNLKFSTDFKSNLNMTSISGKIISITLGQDGCVLVNGARLSFNRDILVQNGVVHTLTTPFVAHPV